MLRFIESDSSEPQTPAVFIPHSNKPPVLIQMNDEFERLFGYSQEDVERFMTEDSIGHFR